MLAGIGIKASSILGPKNIIAAPYINIPTSIISLLFFIIFAKYATIGQLIIYVSALTPKILLIN